MVNKEKLYDVAILGAGMGGSILGTILARQGLSAVIIDKGTHPKYSIGESTVSETNLQMEIMAARYNVPELDYFRSFDRSRAILRTNGIKNNFGFVHHREGRSPTLNDMNQVTVTSALHLFRQDVDTYLFQLAIQYGCEIRQNQNVEDVSIKPDYAEVKLKNETLRAKVVIDGTGHASLLARKFGLIDPTPQMDTHSRSSFTHMVMVGSFDEYVAKQPTVRDRPTAQFDQGTLHHVFEGGWIWVIPMNNNDHSTNPVCSVGLTLDPRVHPDEGLSPEEEWQKFMNRFPAVRQQFANARPVRPWVKAPRIQYTSRGMCGDRFCLLPHAAGFVDPLFSRGLVITTKGVNMVAATVLEAVRDDDFSEARFKPVEEATKGWLKSADQMVSGSFAAFKDYELWNAWLRVWHVFGATRFFGAANRFMDYLETNDHAYLWRNGIDPVLGYEDPRPLEMLQAAHGHAMRYQRGEITAAEATEGVYRELKAADDFFFPLYDVHDRGAHFQQQPTPKEIGRLFRWVHYSPKDFRRIYYSRNFFKQSALLFRILGVRPPQQFWNWMIPGEVDEQAVRAAPPVMIPRRSVVPMAQQAPSAPMVSAPAASNGAGMMSMNGASAPSS